MRSRNVEDIALVLALGINLSPITRYLTKL